MKISNKLNKSRKLLLSVAGAVAVVVPVIFGVAHAIPRRDQSPNQNAIIPALVYEVISVKPNKSGDQNSRLDVLADGFSARNLPLQTLIRLAYGFQDYQISGAPSWTNSERYDVDAKMESSVADEFNKLSQDSRTVVRQRMVQALLADRFKLIAHIGTKELPVFYLVIAKGGPKLKESKLDESSPKGVSGTRGGGGGVTGGGAGEGSSALRTTSAKGVPLAMLVSTLSRELGQTVLDKTGLTSKYDYMLQWAPDNRQLDSNGPSLTTAIQEQLGLKLESGKGPVEILMIDHVERASEN
jgi:uncharacterized protein (TIGR03435 family)